MTFKSHMISGFHVIIHETANTKKAIEYFENEYGDLPTFLSKYECCVINANGIYFYRPGEYTPHLFNTGYRGRFLD